MDERRTNSTRRSVLDEVLEERDYQLKRWEDDEDHTLLEWTSILTIYVAKAVQETYLYRSQQNRKGFRKRMRQVAAIALAALESIGTID